MGNTNGLTRRLDTLESTVRQQQQHRVAFGEIFMQQVCERADRLKDKPAPPLDLQPPIERGIRGALADAEGTPLDQYARIFWSAFVVRMRAYRQENRP